MSFTQLNHYSEPFIENDELDSEVELDDVPGARIIEMLESAAIDSE